MVVDSTHVRYELDLFSLTVDSVPLVLRTTPKTLHLLLPGGFFDGRGVVVYWFGLYNVENSFNAP